MLFTGFTFHIIKRVKYQLIAQCTVATTFLAALASCNADTLPAALAFSTIGSFPVGAMEVTPQVLIQCDSPDADIGAVYGRWLWSQHPIKCSLISKQHSFTVSEPHLDPS